MRGSAWASRLALAAALFCAQGACARLMAQDPADQANMRAKRKQYPIWIQFAPDFEHVAFHTYARRSSDWQVITSSGPTALYVVDLETGERTLLSDNSDPDRSWWSPDGTMLWYWDYGKGPGRGENGEKQGWEERVCILGKGPPRTVHLRDIPPAINVPRDVGEGRMQDDYCPQHFRASEWLPDSSGVLYAIPERQPTREEIVEGRNYMGPKVPHVWRLFLPHTEEHVDLPERCRQMLTKDYLGIPGSIRAFPPDAWSGAWVDERGISSNKDSCYRFVVRRAYNDEAYNDEREWRDADIIYEIPPEDRYAPEKGAAWKASGGRRGSPIWWGSSYPPVWSPDWRYVVLFLTACNAELGSELDRNDKVVVVRREDGQVMADFLVAQASSHMLWSPDSTMVLYDRSGWKDPSRPGDAFNLNFHTGPEAHKNLVILHIKSGRHVPVLGGRLDSSPMHEDVRWEDVMGVVWIPGLGGHPHHRLGQIPAAWRCDSRKVAVAIHDVHTIEVNRWKVLRSGIFVIDTVTGEADLAPFRPGWFFWYRAGDAEPIYVPSSENWGKGIRWPGKEE